MAWHGDGARKTGLVRCGALVRGVCGGLCERERVASVQASSMRV